MSNHYSKHSAQKINKEQLTKKIFAKCHALHSEGGWATNFIKVSKRKIKFITKEIISKIKIKLNKKEVVYRSFFQFLVIDLDK